MGPEYSFSHEAALKFSNKVYSTKSISEIFHIVEKEKVCGIIPLENSIEGPIHESLDNLFKYDNIYINYVYNMEIKLFLASKDGKIKNILYTNHYAYKESEEFIKNLNINKIEFVSSTSEAAKLAKENNSMCICSKLAVENYGLSIIKEINTENNYTKFALISNKLSYDGDSSIILFTIKNKPGALYNVLKIFYKENIDLTMIYSRPLKTIPWEYYFYLEFKGGYNKKLLEQLKSVTEILKFKGSYKFL